MINMRKVKLKIVLNADMHLSFEKGMKNGVSYIYKIGQQTIFKLLWPKTRIKTYYILRGK